ncbi:DNA polymerase III subunit epsilon [Streptomyces sp. R302]|uniref:DNA polymerase III subunit epsilon n=1 Tax=unclassified Streptomyces TaxID=2593676 RepID=UPI00145D0341|nr:MULTISPECIES: DNA polymerase III subunit epsilon [unclassified Streptomyces]NML50734.1 DNA polymerase III subunit epsilon [Streptomyces sp. R301]NML80829.1 DNA polymerase III subunit epsilon [Streptomyces sp. R302]
MNPEARANAYDAPCARCGDLVPAGTGLLRHGRRGWDVYHREHAPAPGPPAAGDHPGWHRRRLLSLDIGSTGNRPERDRITGAAVRGSDGTARDWVLDLGSDLHHSDVGSKIQHSPPSSPSPTSSPSPPAQALEELATLLTDHLASRELLVVWYAPHVLSTLHAELLRHSLTPLVDRLPEGGGVAPICDPLVLDRHVDRYRPGGRSLPAVAEWYGVPHERPGDPASDAEAALLVAGVVAASYPAVARLSRPVLHAEQMIWYAEQMERHPDAPAWPFEPVEPVAG